jgi:hypothetical protein
MLNLSSGHHDSSEIIKIYILENNKSTKMSSRGLAKRQQTGIGA